MAIAPEFWSAHTLFARFGWSQWRQAVRVAPGVDDLHGVGILIHIKVNQVPDVGGHAGAEILELFQNQSIFDCNFTEDNQQGSAFSDGDSCNITKIIQ